MADEANNNAKPNLKENISSQQENKVVKMLYKMSLSVNEIPPLFVQLDQLEQKDDELPTWNEKARWIRYEEQAEDVAGRWSKPHVATLPQTSIDELRELLIDGKMMFDVQLSDMKEIADAIANELLSYFGDFENARKFAETLCYHHHHHHEKKMKKNASQSNLLKVVSSPNFNDMQKREIEVNPLPDSNKPISPNKMKYQYSFTDALTLDTAASISDFKENTKFKKKVHVKAEGASTLVMPLDYVAKPKIVFLRLEAATELQSLLEVKLRSRFIVIVIGSIEKQHQLYEIGRVMSTCLADDMCRDLFYSAQTREDICLIVKQFNRGTMVIPPSEWNPKIRIEPPETFLSKEERKKEPELCNYIHDDESKCNGESHDDGQLKFSKRPFYGMLQDLTNKLPFYISDFADSFNLQCVATTLYMYLVSLCSLVAFGGMIGEKTDNLMATMECILAGSICGAVFSLFSGQPLNIVSLTGPMLILESIIKQLCDNYDIDFLTFRLWTGLWTAFFIIILVMFNLSFLVKYITRFTEDSFAALVAIIFIIDAFKSTYKLRKGPKNINYGNENIMSSLNDTMNNASLNSTSLATDIVAEDPQQQTYFYFSIILFLLTYFISSSLKEFRNKPYLPTKVRGVLSDFAVLIAIIIASVIDKATGLKTQKLTIPSVFEPTRKDIRGWIIPFTSERNPWYTILIAIAPALIATILCFMDQQITAVIINRKEFKLKKSLGYHLDLFVIGISIATCSILGLPWCVAATVLAMSHINSLKMMSENTAPGERPLFIGVREQRCTTLVMSILIGLSVLLTSVLSYIPMAVLYGVFLFMGISTLKGMQFIERILILFMPEKYQPDFKYLRYVKTNRVHLFTVIQLFSTAGLYSIKYIQQVAILFPILVLATCGIRKLMDHIFTQSELFWLDDILPGSRKSKKLVNEKKISENGNDSNEQILLTSNTQIDLLEKNENKSNSPNGAISPKTTSSNQYPVRFVTSFTNIKEDES